MEGGSSALLQDFMSFLEQCDICGGACDLSTPRMHLQPLLLEVFAAFFFWLLLGNAVKEGAASQRKKTTNQAPRFCWDNSCPTGASSSPKQGSTWKGRVRPNGSWGRFSSSMNCTSSSLKRPMGLDQSIFCCSSDLDFSENTFELVSCSRDGGREETTRVDLGVMWG